MRLLGALDVETHEVRSLTLLPYRFGCLLFVSRTDLRSHCCTPKSVAELLLEQLIAGGVLKPVVVAMNDGSTGVHAWQPQSGCRQMTHASVAGLRRAPEDGVLSSGKARRGRYSPLLTPQPPHTQSLRCTGASYARH